ncbi:MAG: hypothetical protein LBL52_03655 [Rickettsiales bacterium]|jgi:hypothetical protein|nr:hypothetical protein [Rickettsiales bacterium]
MGTTAGLLSVFDYAKDKVDSKRKSVAANAEAKRENEYLGELDEIETQKILAKQGIFEEQKENLLKEKLASNKARMAAAGLGGTSASFDAAARALAKKAEKETLANEYFADLDLRKLELVSAYKQSSNLLQASKSGSGSAEVALVKKIISGKK